MSFDYTAWPAATDAIARVTAAGVTLRVGAGDDRTLNVVDGVTEEIARRTQRQFLPGPEGETRYYDGPGTPELEVDEMVLLAGVAVIGLDILPTYALDDAQLTSEQGRPQTRITVARGSVPSYGIGGLPHRWHFPAGRQNIAVTGTFGFAPAIPAALWEAAACEMAVRLSREGLFVAEGRVSLDRAGDEEQRFALPEADGLRWHAQFEAMVRLYKRPQGRRLRNLRNRMI